MKILFCSQANLSRELGASKVVIELAEEMERLGWACTLVGPRELGPTLNGKASYSSLRRYLIEHANEYDVVEYDHNRLPYPRSEFVAETLFVARSVLLAHHFDNISIPSSRGVKSLVRRLTIDRNAGTTLNERIRKAHITVCEADLVNVANRDDKTELVRRGIAEEKIVVIPYGIGRTRRVLFDGVSSEAPQKPKVAFVGTFDNRKGATDFPEIVSAISSAVPGVAFRLLGTFLGRNAVLAAFPEKLRDRIEVAPWYEPNDLPELLASCSVGVFPSYLEGFGFGVLEMLAASVPVVAYDSPGPPTMLRSDFLVPRGDTKGMSSRVVELLKDANNLVNARCWAKERSREFSWEGIAKITSDLYIKHCRIRKSVQAEVASQL